MGGGAYGPPPDKLPENSKLVLGLLVEFSFAYFLKKLRHFHDPVKSYADFVREG